MYFMIDETGSIKGASSSFCESEGLTTVELEVDPSHPLFSNLVPWKIVEGELVEDGDEALIHAKEAKLEELRAICQSTIESGFSYTFDGTQYWFSLDAEAQSNFLSAYQVMRDDIITEIPWTVKVDGVYSRLLVDKGMMEELALAIMVHKTNNIAKLRDFLTPLIQEATSVEDVDAIQW